MVSPFVCIFCQKTGPNLERHLTTKDIGPSVSPEVPPPDASFAVKTESLVEILRREMVTRQGAPETESKKIKKASAAGGKEAKPKDRAPKKKKAIAQPKPVKKKPKKKVKAKPSKSKRMGAGTKIQGATLAEALQGLATEYEKENFKILDPMLARIEPIEVSDQPRVAKLSHGLDRVLFNPGIHHLQDPRSRVYNFDPYLQNIMPVTEFDFEAVASYITSSEDKRLEALAKESGKKYVGSTSSMTSVLSQFHYLLSKWRGINTSTLSKSFPAEYKTFTALSRAPAAIFLRYKGEGTYAIDSDKEYDTDSVLSLLGRSMEKLLTLPPSAYEATYRRSNSQAPSTSPQHGIESYHFSTLGDFLMRSQLDAHDPRLPGTGMFDLKTRAVVSVRMDVQNFHLGSGYQIKSRTGEWESFEREYYDMIRAAFLKYSLQVRMGRMDGIFVAFHNTEKIFGFQYISLDEMDSALHENWDSGIGDQEFKLSLQLLNQVLDRAVEKYPQQSLRLHFETRESLKTPMYVFAEPMAEEEIKEIQQRNKHNLADFLKSLEEKMQHNKRKAESKAMAERFGPVEEDEPEPKGEEEVTGENSVEAQEDISISTADAMDGTDHTSATSEVESDIDQDLETADSSATIEPFGTTGLGVQDDVQEVVEDSKEEVPELAASEDVSEVFESGIEEERTAATVSGDMQEFTEDAGAEEEPSQATAPGDTQEVILEVTEGAGAEEEPPETAALGDTVEASEDVDNSTEESDLEGAEEPDAGMEGAEEPNTGMEGAEDTGTEGAEEPDTGMDGDQEYLEGEEETDTVILTDGSGRTKAPTEILGMTLTVQNYFNGRAIERPGALLPGDRWTVGYILEEAKTQKAAQITYSALKARRKRAVENRMLAEDSDEVNGYIRYLRLLSIKGREWADEQAQKIKTEPVVYKEGDENQ